MASELFAALADDLEQLIRLHDRELDAETHYIRYNIKRQNSEEAIPEILEKSPFLSCCETMLVADVPHSEEGCRNKRQHNDNHDSLQIDSISDMSSTSGNSTRHTEEGVECVNG